MAEPAPRYRRILLKLSGEALQGDENFGINPGVVDKIAREIKQVHDLGVQVAIVTGGGNFFRGAAASDLNIDRASADYMGMLATIINGLALQSALENNGLLTRVISALEVKAVAEPFIRRRAVRHLEKGRVVIFVSGTGNPFFTTDTAAALRAIEIKADILLKATRVEGIYSDDPRKVAGLVKFDNISYSEMLSRELKVMDSTAISLSKDNRLLIMVFNLQQSGNILKAVRGEAIGTLVTLHGENHDQGSA